MYLRISFSVDFLEALARGDSPCMRARCGLATVEDTTMGWTEEIPRRQKPEKHSQGQAQAKHPGISTLQGKS